MSTPPTSGYFHPDTPRTNPEVYEFSLSANPDYDGPMYHVQASFARKLERQNAALLDALKNVSITIRNLASDARARKPWSPQAADNLKMVLDEINSVIDSAALAQAEG